MKQSEEGKISEALLLFIAVVIIGFLLLYPEKAANLISQIINRESIPVAVTLEEQAQTEVIDYRDEGLIPNAIEEVLPPGLNQAAKLAETISLTAQEVVGPLSLQEIYSPQRPLVMPKESIDMAQGRSEAAFTAGIVYTEKSAQGGIIGNFLNSLGSKTVEVTATYVGAAYVDLSPLAEPAEIVDEDTVRIVLKKAQYTKSPGRVQGSVKYYCTEKGLLYLGKDPNEVAVRDEAENALDRAAHAQQQNVRLPSGRSLAEQAEYFSARYAREVLERQIYTGAYVYAWQKLTSNPDYMKNRSREDVERDVEKLLQEFRFQVEVIFK